MQPAWRRWAEIVAVAFVARALVAFVILRSMPLVHDARSYAEFALELLGAFPGERAYYWPPGNSFCLAAAFAAFGRSVVVARGVVVVLGVLGVVLSTLLVRVLAVDGVASRDRAERDTGWLGALYMPAVLLSAQTYAQHLAALALVAVAYFGVRGAREQRVDRLLACGVALGVGALTRPSMLSVAPVLIVAVAVGARGKWARAAIGAAALAVATLAVVLPIALHNHGAGAGYALSTNNERNLFLGNNPYTPDYKTSHLGQRRLDELAPEARAYLESFYRRPDARAAMQHEAVAFMVAHPLVTARRTVNRTTSFWGFDYLASRTVQEARGFGTAKALPWLALEAGAYALVMLLAIASFARRDALDRFARVVLLGMVFAYEAPYAIAFSGGTYHFPVMMLLLPFAGIAASLGRAALVRAARSKVAIALAVAFFAIQAQYAHEMLLMRDAPRPAIARAAPLAAAPR